MELNRFISIFWTCKVLDKWNEVQKYLNSNIMQKMQILAYPEYIKPRSKWSLNLFSAAWNILNVPDKNWSLIFGVISKYYTILTEAIHSPY